MNRKLSTKLLFAFAFVLALTMVLGVFAIRELSAVQATAADLGGVEMEATHLIDQLALATASYRRWESLICRGPVERLEGGAGYARFAFTSATRMITRLPKALAARVIVSSVTETFRGSSRRSNWDRLV